MSAVPKTGSNKQPAKVQLFGTLLRTLTVVGLVLTVVSFNANNHWLADLISQLRVQLAIGAGFVSLLLLLQRRWMFAVLCLTGLLVNAYPISPYLIPTRTRIKSEGSFRLLTANVLTKNRNWNELVDMIRGEDPDFVVLMEVDSTWQQAILSLNEAYPYSKFGSRSDNFGIAFLSKHQWSQIEIFSSGKFSLPSIDVRFEDLQVPGSQGSPVPIRILATHPIPPMNSERWSARNDQLFDIAGQLDESSANIMTGDFNLTPWSPVFTDICERGGLRDSAIGFGAKPTWHVFPTWVGGLKLDHALISEQVEALDHRIGSGFGSDHLPVILDFRFRQD